MERWTILPTLAVRTTGFPIDLLEPLRCVRSAQLVRELIALEQQIDQSRAELLGQYLPNAVREAAPHTEARPLLRLLSAWRHQVTRRHAIAPAPADDTSPLHRAAQTWNAMLEHQASLRAVAEHTWTGELESTRAALWQLAADPRVGEAIFLSNPDVYRAVGAVRRAGGVPPRTAAVRRLERSLISYLQRFCAKNETNSFFGPINYGRLDPTERHHVRVTRSTAPLRRRVTFPTQWMVESLAAAIEREVSLRPFLRPRRGTRWRMLTADCAWDSAANLRVRLDATDATLVALADGSRSVAHLASTLGEDVATTWTRVERLGRGELVVTRLLVPVDRADPLQSVLEWLATVAPDVPARTHWQDVVAELQLGIADLAGDALPERIDRLARVEALFARATGGAVRRGAGAMYADRGLFFEECLGDVESLVLGGAVARDIQFRLQPILNLWHVAARLRAERDQLAARAVLGPARAMPLLRFIGLSRNLTSDRSPDRLDAFEADLRNLVRARSDGRCARLRSSELPTPELTSREDACAFTSVDLMIGAPSQDALQLGQLQLVVGEGHAPPLVWVFPTAHFLADAGDTFAFDLHTALGAQPGSRGAAQLALGRNTKIFPLPLPGKTIELRPHYPDCSAIPAASVEVRSDGGEVGLWTGDERLRLYPPLKRRGSADPFAALTFPAVEMLSIELERHTPRIEIDGVVYQRERWSLPGGGLGDEGARGFGLFLAAWRWKERNGLPREAFVRVLGEPKPVYVDLENPFLIELLDHLGRQNSELTVSEMLPSSSETWLTGRGGRFTAEFRSVAVAETPRVLGETPRSTSADVVGGHA